MSKKVCVLGSGSWGTAQACHLAKCGHDVTVWGRDAAVLNDLANGCNKRYFPELDLGLSDRGLRLTTCTSIAQAVANAQYTVFAVPSSAVRSTAAALKEVLPHQTIVISTAKGLEKGTLLRMSEVLSEELGRLERIAVLSGPSFAAELLQGLPTALTVAAANPKTAEEVGLLYHFDNLRAYSSTDLVGVELGGVLKNVIALAAGITDGCKMGSNARAALLTRGLSELQRLILACGGRASTVTGLSCLGDLLLTATGDLSRNRQVGLRLGRGEKLKDILDSLGQVAEGVNSAAGCLELARKYKQETPIIEETQKVIEGSHSLKQAVENLLSRSPKREA